MLVIATAIAVAGGGLIGFRELTAPERRRVGPLRDLVEVLLPIAGLVVLVVAVWAAR